MPATSSQFDPPSRPSPHPPNSPIIATGLAVDLHDNQNGRIADAVGYNATCLRQLSDRARTCCQRRSCGRIEETEQF